MNATGPFRERPLGGGSPKGPAPDRGAATARLLEVSEPLIEPWAAEYL